MLWADGSEVTVIEGRDGVQPESLGNSHEAGIDPAESVVGVLAGQCSDRFQSSRLSRSSPISPSTIER